MSFTVTVTLHAAPGQAAPLLEAMKVAVANARQAPGCTHAELLKSLDNPDTLMLFEHWATEADQQAYLAKLQASGKLEQLGALLAKPPQTARFSPQDAAPA